VDARQLEATIAKPPSYLTIDDELWYHNLIDHKLQESMRGVTFNTELRMPYETPVASSLWGLLRMGIYDLGNGKGRWPGATHSQHYTAAVGHRLWFLLRMAIAAAQKIYKFMSVMVATFLKGLGYLTNKYDIHSLDNIYKCGSSGLSSHPLSWASGPLSCDSDPLSQANINDDLMGWAHYLGLSRLHPGATTV
jgi:hypothetical protein